MHHKIKPRDDVIRRSWWE